MELNHDSRIHINIGAGEREICLQISRDRIYRSFNLRVRGREEPQIDPQVFNFLGGHWKGSYI